MEGPALYHKLHAGARVTGLRCTFLDDASVEHCHVQAGPGAQVQLEGRLLCAGVCHVALGLYGCATLSPDLLRLRQAVPCWPRRVLKG